MKRKIFAAVTAFLLSLTPLTAHAGSVIVVEPEVNLEDYTTSYTALKEADHIMYSGNQVLIHWELPVMTQGCEIIPNTMEWEVSGTADVTFETDSFFKSVSYEENYANTYCLITANSPGSVRVVGTEFYFNFTVGEDGNFDQTVTYDKPVEPYTIAGDSVHFPKPDTPCQFDLIVSSNLECTVTHDKDGCTFTPEEDGWYVVSTRAFCEEIVNYGESGHFHYFYPVLTNYTVTVKDDEITVTEQGSKNWHSEEQIDKMISKAEFVENLDSYDVYAADPDDVFENVYFSFVNGQLPSVQGDYKSYITNVYTEYGTDSYFCVNYCFADVQQDMNGNEPQRVFAEEMDISSLLTHYYTSSGCDGNLMMPSPDMMELARVSAPGVDGDLTILVDNPDGVYTYSLTVEDGIFRHRKAASDPMGDCNGDGKCNVLDLVMLHRYLFGKGTLTTAKNADLCADGSIDAFDLAMLKRKLLG